VSAEVVVVDGWSTPSGYTAGRIGTGRTLHVAGCVGWDAQCKFHSTDLVEQFGRALGNVVAVVHAARGRTSDIASMTIYVTDIGAYRARRRELGPVWRDHMLTHYPAMALVGVSALVEPEALVEIQAIAHLAHEDDNELVVG
jgi:enamine deaminase RidA (YjgF/YER057c/UK114 family)